MTSFCILASSFAFSQDIKLVTGKDYPPYAAPDLPEGGVVTEVVSRVFEATGYTVSLKYYPWKRGLAMVEGLKSDATFPYAKTAEREKNFLYSRPLNEHTVSIFQNVETSRLFREPGDLIGLVYCQPLGYKTEDEIEALINTGDINRVRSPTVDGCLDLLAQGHADFIALNRSVAWAVAQKRWSEKAAGILDEAKIPLRTATEHLIVSRNHPHAEKIINLFDQTYQKLLENGEIAAIWKRHLGAGSFPGM
ncbi:transporter substrate-binding domain-containing protein [Kiloniella laminariae]|uniref:Transporter substrate-binding domain-containing protein n=1 Tax=Kiloniella laminariae TaxID=454162 RepID=A0ABT4LNU4_9PROT|nr:transporter substrate-binding domain-containing protein [Kiloniella laminariae]MCZ4282768.1 transporter substrate-binding domain-containing protein [Kiloniella laminariae]